MLMPEFHEFLTEDGLLLPGLLYRAEKSKKVVVYLHGNGSSSVFYDEYKKRDLARHFVERGISFFAFNNRGAHIIKRLNVTKNQSVESKLYGMAYELIRECVEDIDGAVRFLNEEGFQEFYLMGHSTGANKICVYNHCKQVTPFLKYVLLAGGDDCGIIYSRLGKETFLRVLTESKAQIAEGNGDLLISDPALFPGELFSYKSFYDIANPDGDYNCFPFYDVQEQWHLSTKEPFAYFKEIQKPSMVVYGEKDEYSADTLRSVEMLKQTQPGFTYFVVANADHGFTGYQGEMARTVCDWLLG